ELAIAERDNSKFDALLGEISQTLADRRRHPIPEKPVVPETIEDDNFDIFSGTSDRDAVWLEVVSGLEAARKRVHEISGAGPGDYFLFHAGTHAIIRIDSASSDSKKEDSPPKSGAA